MREVGVAPDKRHRCMAMFTCVASDMCPLAESIFNSLLKSKQQLPATALYTLYLRALLQQNKWEEAEQLFSRMMIGKDCARPNSFTLNYLLQYQMLGGRWEQAADTLNIIAESLENTAAASSASSSSGTASGKQRTGAAAAVTVAAGLEAKSGKGGGLDLPSSSVALITKKRQSSCSRLLVPLSTLQGTYHAMSLALGSYSDTLQRLKQQETMRLQRAEDALKGR